MYEIDVEIAGIVPLLHHNPETQLLPKTTPEDEFVEACLYKDSKGRICIPRNHIKGAMIKAATDFQIRGRGKKTYKNLVKAGFFVEPDMIPMETPNGYAVDKQWTVNPATRGRNLTARPRFDEWKAKFRVVVVVDELTPEITRQILEFAGKYVAIGTYRPDYGRFEVTSFNVQALK